MSLAYPIPRQTRQAILTAHAGQTVFGPSQFLLFNVDDVEIWVQSVATGLWSLLDPSAYTVTPVAPAIAFPALFLVTLDASRPEGDTLAIFGSRLGSRTTDVTRAGVLQSQALETELDRQVATEQELRRDVGRAVLAAPGVAGQILPPPAANQALGWDSSGVLGNIVIVPSASMIKATLADADAGVDDFRYMTPLTVSSLLSQKRVFATRAAFRAAHISPAISVVEVLGTLAIGDNGRASFARIGPSTPAAWREQSADGQWWAINERIVTPEVFFAFSGQDCTAAFAQMSLWLSSATSGGIVPGGVTVNFKPGADYQIWPAGTVPSAAIVLTGAAGITFNFNGAQISTNNEWTAANASVFSISNCAGLTFNNPAYTGSADGAATGGVISELKYGLLFHVTEPAAPWTRNILITNATMFWGSALLVVSGDLTGAAARQANNIVVLNATLTHVFYGLNFQGSGDNVFARGISGTDMGRIYFPWNVSNHDIEVTKAGGGAGFVSCLLKAYGLPQGSESKRSLTNIKLRFRDCSAAVASAVMVGLDMQQFVPQVNVTGAANNGGGLIRLAVNSTADMASGQTWFCNSVGGVPNASGKFAVTVIDATHLDLQGSVFAGAYTAGGYLRVPAALRDIEIHAEATLAQIQPSALLTFKENFDGSHDTTTDGYTVENIAFSGSLKNYDYGVPAITLFCDHDQAAGTWVGETIRNIRLHDLTITGSNSSVVIDASNVQANLALENIWSTPATVPWTLTGAVANTRIRNVSATGVTDRVTVVPGLASTHQFSVGISTVTGAQSFLQPSYSDLTGSIPLGTGFNTLSGTALAAPASPGAGFGTLWFDLSDLRLHDKNAAGAVGTTVVADAGAANQFLTAILTNGAIAKAQPSFANLSGSISASQLPAFSGDITTPAGSTVTTLATVNVNVGTFGSATQAAQVTLNGKGLATAAANVTITPAIGNVTGLGTNVATALAIAIGSAGAPVTNGGALGSPSSAGTLPAHTLGGTVSGGGNAINNVVIGASTPLAGTFTTLTANTSVSSPLHIASGTLKFQSNGGTFAGSISTGQQWTLGSDNAPPAGPVVTVNKAATAANQATSNGSVTANVSAHFVGADGSPNNVAMDAYGNGGAPGFITRRAQGTQAAPTAVLSGDSLFAFVTQGYFGSGAYAAANWSNFGGLFVSAATENWDASHQGQCWQFYTTATGGTSLGERMRIGSGLMVGLTTDPGIGNASIANALQVGSFTVATLPAGVTGRMVWCSNCRVFNGAGVQEGGGAGTGGLVTYNGSAWKIAGTNVTAIA